MDVEFLELNDPDHLQQGDLLEWYPGHADALWRTFGLVITADCDLAWRKHCSSVCFVPIVPAMTLLEKFVIPDLLQKACLGYKERIAALIKRVRGKDSDAISHGAISDWISRCGPAGVIAELSPNAPDSDELLKQMEGLMGLQEALVVGTSDRYFAAIQAEPAAEQRRVTDKLRSFFASPPGDVFFIDALSPSLTGGFFALLRFPQLVEEGAVALIRLDAASRSVTCRRIARMRSPFLYRLTQAFAAVFSDIGLPESRRAAALQVSRACERRLLGGRDGS